MRDLKRMRDFCPAPSDAVRAMVMGLRTARKTKNFIVEMDVYSHVNTWSKEKICFGCAATCTIFESLDLWPQMREYAVSRGPDNVAEDAAEVERLAGVDWDDLRRFEIAIDDLRGDGEVERLCKYYEVDVSLSVSTSLPLLGSSYSEWELLEYEAFADALKTAGL